MGSPARLLYPAPPGSFPGRPGRRWYTPGIVPSPAKVRNWTSEEAALKERLEAKLRKELVALDRELKVELPRQIKLAVAHGDLRENADYQTALERQSLVRIRVGHIRRRLGELSMMKLDSVPRDRIGLGSRVVLYEDETDRKVTYELVLPDDGDVAQGRISIASPIGKGIMNHREGDEVSIRTPSGTRVYEILELKTLHDLSREEGEDDDGGESPE